jgi:hypothetical protein
LVEFLFLGAKQSASKTTIFDAIFTLKNRLQALDDIRTTILEGWKSYELEAAVKIMIQGQMVSV